MPAYLDSINNKNTIKIQICYEWKIMLNLIYACLLLISLTSCLIEGGRNIHRPQDPSTPVISANWINDTHRYSIKNNFLQEYPFFETFDKEHFFDHYLPMGQISYRNKPSTKVEGTVLAQLIDELIEELDQKRKLRKLKRDHDFKHFIVLKKGNFNRKKKYGFIILKFKDYPFVVKLSIETPQSFVNPFKKGFEPTIFFYMAGGINRHMSGFTRIKNAQHVKNCIAQTQLPVEFDMPRKWFYMPKESQWIELHGKNIGVNQTAYTKIPGTYCIVADAIECERIYTLLNKEDRDISMQLCNAVKFSIDPHIDNFMVEKDTNKVVIIDTEHFPSITGLTDVSNLYTSQISWYADLSIKCVKDMFFRDKQTRRTIQRNGTHHYQL